MATVGQVWPVATDCMITLSGLKDDQGNYINNATVTGNLVDSNNVAVTNGSNIAFTYVASSNGQYQAVLPYNAATQNGQSYTMNILAISGSKRAMLVMQRQAAYIQI